jgi:hypothetical protein
MSAGVTRSSWCAVRALGKGAQIVCRSGVCVCERERVCVRACVFVCACAREEGREGGVWQKKKAGEKVNRAFKKSYLGEVKGGLFRWQRVSACRATFFFVQLFSMSALRVDC